MAEVKKATLYGPAGEKVVVDVGSQQASSLQSQGYGLTAGSYKAPSPAGVVTSTAATPTPTAPKAPVAATTPTTTAPVPPSPTATTGATTGAQAAPMPPIQGSTRNGEVVKTDNPEVQAYMAKYPGVSAEVAIGSVVMEKNKKLPQPVTMVGSDLAKADIQKNMAEVDRMKGVNTAESQLDLAKYGGYEELYGQDPETAAQLKQIDDDYNTFAAALEKRKLDLEASNKAAVEGIQNQFNQYREEERRRNANKLKSSEIIGGRSGRQRYAPEIQSGIQDTEVKAGLDRLKQLDQQEQQLISQAEKAASDEQWQMLGLSLQAAKETRQEKAQVMDRALERMLSLGEFGMKKQQAALDKLSSLAQLDNKELDPTEVEKMEKESGVPTGTFNALRDLTIEAKKTETMAAEQETAQNELEKQKTQQEINAKYADVLSKIPEGTTVDINGTKYTGLKQMSNNNKLTTVTGQDGKKYSVVIDVDGNVTTTPLAETGNPGTVSPEDAGPVGTKIASTYKDGQAGGQCGAFVHNFVADWPYGLNTIEQKIQQIDESIGTADNPPQVGDVLIQKVPGSAAAQWGHVAVINSYDPNSGIMTLTESNYVGHEIVSNYRKVNVGDKSVAGFFRGNLKPSFTQTLGEGSHVKGTSGATGELTKRPQTGSQVQAQGGQTEMREVSKLLTGYPTDFKKYVQSIQPKVQYKLDDKSIKNLYDQFVTMGNPTADKKTGTKTTTGREL